MSDLIRSIPAVDLRSTEMELLCLVNRSEVGGGDEAVSAFGLARSTRRTEAPKSASSRPANGPVVL